MKWIDVKDRLPKAYVHVILWGIAIGDDLCESCINSQQNSEEICDIYLGYINEDEIFVCDYKLDHIKVSHWMELPSKPNGNAHFEGCVPRITESWSNPSELLGYECKENCPQKGK